MGITGTGPLSGPPAFISVPESGEGSGGSGEGVLGVGGDARGGMAGLFLGAGSLAPGLSGPPCAPATVGVSSIPHISTSTRAISASPTSAAIRIVSLPSMGTLYLAWLFSRVGHNIERTGIHCCLL